MDSTSVVQNQEVIYDLDSEIEVQKLDQDKIESYKNDKAFDYREKQEVDNWWTQFKNWLAQAFMKFINWLFGTNEANSFWAGFFNILPYLVIIAVLFLLVWLFMKVNPREMLLENEEIPQVAFTDEEDIIHNQDIRDLINQAIKQQNFRLAIRYYYLLVLKNLSEAEYIDWESQKTNTDYSKELTDSNLREQFKVITKLYDFIWYGSFEVNQNTYQQAEKEFLSITQSIQK